MRHFLFCLNLASSRSIIISLIHHLSFSFLLFPYQHISLAHRDSYLQSTIQLSTLLFYRVRYKPARLSARARPETMPSIPNLALRGLQVRLFLSFISSSPSLKLTSSSSFLQTALFRNPHPRPLWPPRRISSLRWRPLLHKLQRLPRHLALRDCADRAFGGFRVCDWGAGDGGVGRAERAVCVCGGGGAFELSSSSRCPTPLPFPFLSFPSLPFPSIPLHSFQYPLTLRMNIR